MTENCEGLITIKNLTVEYWQQSHWARVIENLSLTLAPAETFGLVGESGCGKSTTAHALLGFLPRGVMPPTFDEVAFAMQPGEISDVIRSEFGFHVIQVVEIDPSRRVPDELWPVVQERAFVTWLEEQRAQADIQIAAWVTEAQEG